MDYQNLQTRMRYTKHLIPLLLMALATACDDMRDKLPAHDLPQAGATDRIYVLCEGLFQLNNSRLAHYDFNNPDSTKRFVHDFFRRVNKRGLGDTANDMRFYGSKLYIVVNVSSQIEVVDAQTGFSIKQIPLFDEQGRAREPRYIDFHEGKAYVCSFDGTVARIDTASLEVEAFAKVGRNPDGICIVRQKIYVSNSGGLDHPNYDHTVSVVDIASFKEIKKIDVGMNPYKIHADTQNDVYVTTRGDYGKNGYAFHKIDSQTDEKVHSFNNLSVYNFEIFNDRAYLYHYDFNKKKSWIKVFDCRTESIIDDMFIKDSTVVIATPYSISINPYNEDVYVTDALNFENRGSIFCFNKEGFFKFRIRSVGVNPNRVLFLQNPK